MTKSERCQKKTIYGYTDKFCSVDCFVNDMIDKILSKGKCPKRGHIRDIINSSISDIESMGVFHDAVYRR